MGESRIPEISDEELRELHARIKPVVRFNIVTSKNGEIKPTEVYEEGLLFYIKDVDPRDVAFTWEPEPVKKADGLERLDDIVTYHTFGAPILFKPSIAEVLAQIPEKYKEKAVAFEVRTNDMGPWNVISNEEGSYHVTVTRLYQEIKIGGR